MPQSITQKVVNTFVRGLITEAGELTFPEDASIDELNCILNRDGARRRRLAVKVEEGNALSTFTVSTTQVFTSGKWTSVGGTAGLEFIVVQTGPYLYFYNTSTEPYSAQQKSFSVDMTSFEHTGSAGAGTVRVQMASINGDLVVVSSEIEPFYISYNKTADTISTNQISPKTRDFDWQGDTDTYYEEAPTPSLERQYDTANAGWIGEKGLDALSKYESSNSAYPPLTHPWYSGKDAAGDFKQAEWRKVFGGTTLTGNGHFILDFFAKNRSAASGIAGIATEFELTRFKAVAAFAGRIFYAGLTSAENSGKILFSKQLDSIREAGKCHQQNDPTSEYFSDLLATDGGVIIIPDASNIQKLHTFGPSLFVFAENGVWQISGVDDVFRATEYSISRVSEIGITNPQSFISVEGVPFWWSKDGIHTLAFDEVSAKPREQNLTLGTIQTFFDAIDGNARLNCHGVYDNANKRLHWFFPNNNETIINKKNRVLTLDIAVQAFYPWTIADSDGNTDYILSAEYINAFGSDFINLDVFTSAGDDVVTVAGDDVVVNQLSQLSQANANITLLTLDRASGKMTMGLFAGIDFLDWGDANYSSYAEAGYDFIGDLVLKKNSPYIQVYLRPTEEGFTGSEALGYTPIRESSLLVSSYWDFRKNTSSSPQQAYRLKYMPIVDAGELASWNYPENIVTTRLKTRGRGRNMRLRFESEQGKDFVLLGFGVIHAANSRY